jgi:hypothetical protein
MGAASVSRSVGHIMPRPSEQRSPRPRLLILSALNTLLLFIVPNMARSKHIPPYEGQLLCGSVASAIIVLSFDAFRRGGLWQRVLAALLLVLPALVMWDIFKYGIP